MHWCISDFGIRMPSGHHPLPSAQHPATIRLSASFAAGPGTVVPCERKPLPRLPCRPRSCATPHEVRCSGFCTNTMTLWWKPGAIAGQIGWRCAPGLPSSRLRITTASRSKLMQPGPMQHERRGNGSAPQRRKKRPTRKPNSTQPARPARWPTMHLRGRRLRQTRRTVRTRPRHKGCPAPRSGWLS